MTGASTTPLVSVYDGQTCIGFIIDRGKAAGFEALDHNERSVGTFKTQRAAADAISEAQR